MKNLANFGPDAPGDLAFWRRARQRLLQGWEMLDWKLDGKNSS
jgi:hypothetical protein